MSNVVPFGRPAKGDREKQTYNTGEAKCSGCGHLWVAVDEAGEEDKPKDREAGLECSKCGSFKGHFIRYQYYDCPIFPCKACGRFIFTIILAKGDVPCAACANCSCLHNLIDCFPTP